MSEYNFVVKLAFSNVFTKVHPSVQGDTHISCSLYHVNFIRVCLKFEKHGNVIEVRIGIASGYFAYSLITSKQEKISRISPFNKLLFTHIVKSPWFLKTKSILLLLVAFTHFNLGSYVLLPQVTYFLIFCLELKFTVKTFNFELEMRWVLIACIKMYLKMIKINNAVWKFLLLSFSVGQLFVFENNIPFLPSLE